MLLWINQQTTKSWLSNFVVTMFLKKVALIMSSLFDKFKRDRFWAPFLKASDGTTENGGGKGSIFILVGNPYKSELNMLPPLHKLNKNVAKLQNIVQLYFAPCTVLVRKSFSNLLLAKAKTCQQTNFFSSIGVSQRRRRLLLLPLRRPSQGFLLVKKPFHPSIGRRSKSIHYLMAYLC